jgi:hypothetical protein
LLELALILLGRLDILFQLLLQILAGGLKVGEVSLELRILRLVPFELLGEVCAGAQR